jgi:multidrug efflux pump subunit AcrA (membrane-fusion protein)
MEHDVVAPHDGIVREVRVEAGQQVDAGDVLVVLEESTAGHSDSEENGEPGTGNGECIPKKTM